MSVPCEELSAQPVLTKNVTKNKQISQKKKTTTTTTTKTRWTSLAHLKCLPVSVGISTWRHNSFQKRSVFRFSHVRVIGVEKEKKCLFHKSL